MKIRTLLPILLGCFLLYGTEARADEKMRVVATTSNIASIAREVLGEKADIYYVASPNQNVHFISPNPKDVLKVKRADVFIHSGLDLEAWRDPLLDAAGNTHFLGEGKYSIDVSKGIPLLEVPVSLSRTQGDIHLFGNPHYWMDPENTKVMARNIAEGLTRIVPEKEDSFRANAEVFCKKIDQKMKEWSQKMAPYRGSPVITYHRNWPYFAQRFGLVLIGELEPKPGIPPTAKHLEALIKIAKEKKVKMIFKESFHENRTPAKIGKEIGADVLTLTQSVGETKDSKDYISMMERDIRLILESLEAKREGPK